MTQSILPNKNTFIATPLYDSIFFIGAPLIALILGFLIYLHWLPNQPIPIGQTNHRLWELLILVILTQSHLFIVFFRSHLNTTIFKKHPFRFIAVPILMMIATYFSQWILVTAIVLNTWWDVYHSSLQTFGFARAYDAKAGNPPTQGRRLDYLLNLWIYMGPAVAGAVLWDHLQAFQYYNAVGAALLTQVPAYVNSKARFISWAVTTSGLAFLAYYVSHYWRAYRNGYQISVQKVTILALTAFTSLIGWGFNSFGVAFVIMNFFHAWQYFAIVYWTERENIAKTFKFHHFPASVSKTLALGIVLITGLGFGVWTAYGIAPQNGNRLAVCLLATVATMHFWYDGFIWSVQKREF